MDKIQRKERAQPLPAYACDMKLANDFASFFKEKSDKIDYSFPDCDPTNTDTNDNTKVPNLVSDISQFTNFREVTDEEIVKYVQCASNKYCAQLDPLPSQLVKDNRHFGPNTNKYCQQIKALCFVLLYYVLDVYQMLINRPLLPR